MNVKLPSGTRIGITEQEIAKLAYRQAMRDWNARHPEAG